MLIALDIPLTDVQHRLGHRKPDTTLRVYLHQWKERDASRSDIGQQLQALFTTTARRLPPAQGGRPPLALPPPT
jgi:integrase